MIALLNSGHYFISDYAENINDLLIDYASYIGAVNMRVFKILVNSNEMSTEELIKYINEDAYSYEDKIISIYKLGEIIFKG